jgi:hypothetical protein
MGNYGRIREIEFMNSTVNRINFDGSSDIETCLLEPKRESACPSEEIDPDRSHELDSV